MLCCLKRKCQPLCLYSNVPFADDLGEGEDNCSQLLCDISIWLTDCVPLQTPSSKLARAQTQGPALLEGAGVINSYSVRLLFLHKPQWLFTRVEAFDEIVTVTSLHLSWMDAPWNDRALFYWSETLPMFITMALGLSLSSHSGSYSPCSPCGCPMCIQTGCWWENRVHEPLWRP